MISLFLTRQVIAAMVRHVLTAAGGALVAQGMADAATVEAIVGGGVAAVGVVWSILQKRGMV